MPGMGEEIEGAMQHAPQPGRQSMAQCRRIAHFEQDFPQGFSSHRNFNQEGDVNREGARSGANPEV